MRTLLSITNARDILVWIEIYWYFTSIGARVMFTTFFFYSLCFLWFFLISTAPTVQRYLWFNFVNIWWLITDKLCLIHKKSSFCFSLIQFCLEWCAIMSIWMWSFLKSRGFLIKIGFHVKSFDSESFWSNYLVPFRLNYRNSVRSFAVTNDRLRNLYICTLVS